jgi:Transaldolase
VKLFLDTAHLHEIHEAANTGLLDGVTTNPSLMKQAVEQLHEEEGEDIDLEEYIERIVKAANGKPVSLEVTGHTYDDMVEEGRRLFDRFNKINDNVFVKIPVNPSFGGEERTLEGVRAIDELTSEGIPVNATLIFTPEQALMASKAGATYVSPFAGRINDLVRAKAGMDWDKGDYFPAKGMEEVDDNGVKSGIDLIRECAEIKDSHGFDAEVLAASIRNKRMLREAALVGADIVTAPPEMVKESLRHEKTVEGMESFTEDTVEEYAEITGGDK